MRKKNVLVFIFDGFADCETAHALTGITTKGRFEMKTLAMQMRPVRSLAGLCVLPDADFRPLPDLQDIDSTNTAMLILPGGAAWECGLNPEVGELVMHCILHEIPVAAIGSATLFLADLGLLDSREHTSNNLRYLVSRTLGYDGLPAYRPQSSVSAPGVITAASEASAEFAENIFEILETMPEPVVGVDCQKLE